MLCCNQIPSIFPPAADDRAVLVLYPPSSSLLAVPFPEEEEEEEVTDVASSLHPSRIRNRGEVAEALMRRELPELRRRRRPDISTPCTSIAAPSILWLELKEEEGERASEEE